MTMTKEQIQQMFVELKENFINDPTAKYPDLVEYKQELQKFIQDKYDADNAIARYRDNDNFSILDYLFTCPSNLEAIQLLLSLDKNCVVNDITALITIIELDKKAKSENASIEGRQSIVDMAKMIIGNEQINYINTIDTDGKTALDYVNEESSSEIRKLLEEKGAKTATIVKEENITVQKTSLNNRKEALEEDKKNNTMKLVGYSIPGVLLTGAGIGLGAAFAFFPAARKFGKNLLSKVYSAISSNISNAIFGGVAVIAAVAGGALLYKTAKVVQERKAFTTELYKVKNNLQAVRASQ